MSKSISNFLWLFSLITTPLIAAAMPNIFIPEEVLISEQTGIIIEMLVNLEDLDRKRWKGNMLGESEVQR